MANYSNADVVSSDDESAYELIDSPPPPGEHLSEVVKRQDSDEKYAKIEELEKKVAEMSSQLEEANMRTANQDFNFSELLSKLEDMAIRDKKIIRVAREYELRLEYAEKQLDSNQGMKETLAKKDERVKELEKKVAKMSSQLEEAMRIAQE
ncbi:hypothetical protein PENTCL1PPCAC_10480 [Pristionchus entomophagus]|uniref:Uncharacterized protein n=1 Tax=Pristionchus entomophagus TaxID=358040 RepID=A0AAV5T7M9_9BILA|nr:hypothetical protein PENTCL1PPCAC_10480 [Pristionchus entomophagus]